MTLPPAAAALLQIDAEVAAAHIAGVLRNQVFHVLHRKGAVVGLSGGIDSSVVTALAARALGRERVVAVLMPERESSGESLALGRLLAAHFGIEAIVEDITPALEACGCYARRDEMIRSVVPEYRAGYQCKIVLPDLQGEAYRIHSIVVRAPDGTETRARLTPTAYRGIVAATNFKQRMRKMFEYFHADRLGYAVAGTPNRLEYDQGFFVKGGDGAADVKPIAHLYKTQVYALAAHLGVPDAIRTRPPTTDTYPLAQTQEEFYFSLPYDQMDVCVCARNQGIPPETVAGWIGLPVTHVRHVYDDIAAKRRATRYQHAQPLLVEPVGEIGAAGGPDATG